MDLNSMEISEKVVPDNNKLDEKLEIDNLKIDK